MSEAPRRMEIAAVAALALLPILPFVNNAVSIDGPVFVAVAQQVLETPADPFGFEMVWDSTSSAAASFNRNPPLLSYWLAPFLGIFGGADAALHAALLPFPLIAALSFFGIARRVTGEGLLPTGLLIATPSFLVLATTLMLDVPVLAWMLLAVYALLRAGEEPAARWELLAGVAAAAAGLTKYVGFSIAPLLAAGWWLLTPRRAAGGLRMLGPPLLTWTLWGAYTAIRYGEVHFLGSTDVVLDAGRLDPDELWNHLASTPIYLGCALVFPIFLWLRALRPRAHGTELAVVGVLLGAAAVTFALPDGEPARRLPLEREEAVFAALGLAGACVLFGSILRPRRVLASPLDGFLALWLGGTIAYSAFVNWHVNAADALLAAPPAILLLYRTPEQRPPRRWAQIWIGGMLALSLLLATADAIQSNFYRTAARMIAAEIGERPGDRYFVGQWGLHHYLSREGFEAVVPATYGQSEFEAGDWIATARNVSQIDVVEIMNAYDIRLVWSWERTTWLPLRTTNADASGGFYSHHSGYTPFAWSVAPVERVQLGRVVGTAKRDGR